MSMFTLQEFDREDPKNTGRPNFFCLEDYFNLIQQYITADEVSKALWLIDNPPEFYVQNVPIGSVMIKEQLLKRLFTHLDYANDGCSIEDIATQPVEQMKAGIGLERGFLTYNVVKEFNAKDERPWIYELGPGNYWLPFMLQAHVAKFKYFAPSLNVKMQRDAADRLLSWADAPKENQKKIFVAFEILEHLLNPEEIFHHSIKAGGNFDTILLSTPRGTFGGGRPDWHLADLGHVCTYMPKSFLAFAQKHWPQYKWQLFDGPVMLLRGDK